MKKQIKSVMLQIAVVNFLIIINHFRVVAQEHPDNVFINTIGGFTKNLGQLLNSDREPADDVQYYSESEELSYYLLEDRISYVFNMAKDTANSDTLYRLDMTFANSNETPETFYEGYQQFTKNYYQAHTGFDGIVGVPVLDSITYLGLINGINISVKVVNGILFQIEIEQNHSLNEFEIHYEIADSIEYNAETGVVYIFTEGGSLKFDSLYAFYLEGNEQVPVGISVHIDGVKLRFETELIPNDRSLFIIMGNKPLAFANIIPSIPEGPSMSLPWSSFLNNMNIAAQVKDVYYSKIHDVFYVTGEGGSADFPVSQGAFTNYNSALGVESFVLKFNSTRQIQWGSYFGGSAFDSGTKVIENSEEYVYLAGVTMSSDLPICISCVPADPRLSEDTYRGGGCDIFIAKFDAFGKIQQSLTGNVFSTYFGGSGNEIVTSLGIDSHDNILIGGIVNWQSFADFPTEQRTGAFFRPFAGSGINNGGEIGFFARITPGDEIDWCTAFGGDYNDQVTDVAFDKDDNVILLGWSNSFGPTSVPSSPQISNTGNLFPLVNPGGNVFFRSNAGSLPGFDGDLFISKFNTSGELIWSTMFGGEELESGFSFSVNSVVTYFSRSGLGVTSDNKIVFSGITHSGISGSFPYFPVEPITNGFNASYSGSDDGFIAMIDNNSLVLEWSTYFGGSDFDYVTGLATSAYEDWIYVTGYTRSYDFEPIVHPSFHFFQNYHSSGNGVDLFLIRFGSNGMAYYGSFIGGEHPGGGDAEWTQGIDCDGGGYHVIIGGATTSDATTFPTNNIWGNQAYFYAQPSYGTPLPFLSDFYFLCNPCLRMEYAASQTVNHQAIAIYPNPASNEFYFKETDTKSISVNNYSGVLVRRFDSVIHPVHIEDLPPGYYLVKMNDNSNVASMHKLIITR